MSALPYRPLAVQVGPPVSVPVLPRPDLSAAVVPLPSLNDQPPTSPLGPVLVTVTVTGVDTVDLPEASRAVAVIWCDPLATDADDQETE